MPLSATGGLLAFGTGSRIIISFDVLTVPFVESPTEVIESLGKDVQQFNTTLFQLSIGLIIAM